VAGGAARPAPPGDLQDLREGAARRAGAALRFHLRVGRPRAANPGRTRRSKNAGGRSPAGVDRDRLVWTGRRAGVKCQVAAALMTPGSPATPSPGSPLIDRLSSTQR